MKIVIDISENIYNLIARGEESRDFVYKSDLMRAVLEGTPLPKGHGRLIDADELIVGKVANDWTRIQAECANTIIEADKENKVDCKRINCDNCVNHKYCDYE